MPLPHYPLGYVVTPATLASSKKGVVDDIRSTHWIFPRDKTQGNVLYKDVSRRSVTIEGREFLADARAANQTPSEELLDTYLLNLGFTASEITLLKECYQQPLQGFPVNLLNTAFPLESYIDLMGHQLALPLIRKNCIANIYKKNNKIYCEVVVDNLSIQHWPEDGDIDQSPTETIPGKVTAHYVLTADGFLFKHIETTTALLKDLIQANSNHVLTQKQISRANEEHRLYSAEKQSYDAEKQELYLAEKQLYDALTSGRFSRAETFVARVILDEVIAQSKMPENNLVVLIEAIRFTHRFLESPDNYLNCHENFETCLSVIKQVTDYTWGKILGNLLLVLVSVGLGLSIVPLLAMSTTAAVVGVSSGIASSLSLLSFSFSSANIYHEIRRKQLTQETLLDRVFELINAKQQTLQNQERHAPEAIRMG